MDLESTTQNTKRLKTEEKDEEYWPGDRVEVFYNDVNKPDGIWIQSVIDAIGLPGRYQDSGDDKYKVSNNRYGPTFCNGERIRKPKLKKYKIGDIVEIKIGDKIMKGKIERLLWARSFYAVSYEIVTFGEESRPYWLFHENIISDS